MKRHAKIKIKPKLKPTPIPAPIPLPPIRKYFRSSFLFALVRRSFEPVFYSRGVNASIPLTDALMSAFAMFVLKDPSLLQFDHRRKSGDPNLHRIFGIEQVPCDSQLRTLLDPVTPESLRPAFNRIFAILQRAKALSNFAFLEDHYLISGDGTGFFYSQSRFNDSCLIKTDSATKKKSFHQAFYGLCMVHPDLKVVLPLPPEFIVNTDGSKKNDCERNASKRACDSLRAEHPRMKFILVEDALASNGPHIRELMRHNIRYILGVKESDHKHLYEQTYELEDSQRAHNLEMIDPANPRVKHVFFYINDLSLNKTCEDLKVHFLDHWQYHLDKDGLVIPKSELHFSWITDIPINDANVYQLMRGGRARWKIENETFNTLKNQGYHLEHCYGLGKEHLSKVFVMLMLLAFLVDQVQKLCNNLYKAALEKRPSQREFFERIRSAFNEWNLDSLETVYGAIYYGFERTELIDAVSRSDLIR